MTAWPGKYIIGLTGNIATGKSVVRKMLEHLGAYGIDADALGHRVIAQGAPGYQPVIDAFGRWVLGPDEQIDRNRLARVVFGDPQALATLEGIVHPLVRQAVDILVRRSPSSVVVIEAIKLIESPLRQACDTLIVTYAPKEIQMARLKQKRGMSEDIARQRISAQSPQEDKMAVANFVVRNETSFEETWRQVSAIWAQIFPSESGGTEPVQVTPAKAGEMTVVKARPRLSGEIAAFISKVSGVPRTREQIMASFGEKAFLILKLEGKLAGVAGWQVENLVARTDDVFIDPNLPLTTAMQKILDEVEHTSRDLQCEASLLFLPPNLARVEEVWRSLGYEPRSVQSLGVRAWQEAAVETMPSGSVMLFKQLRKDRVLRPV